MAASRAMGVAATLARRVARAGRVRAVTTLRVERTVLMSGGFWRVNAARLPTVNGKTRGRARGAAAVTTVVVAVVGAARRRPRRRCGGAGSSAETEVDISSSRNTRRDNFSSSDSVMHGVKNVFLQAASQAPRVAPCCPQYRCRSRAASVLHAPEPPARAE